MNEEMDLKQSRSTMEIVVAIGAKTTCCNQSPPSQKNYSERRDFRCCTITCFNCFSCLVVVQRLGVSWMFPKKSCSLPPQKCFKLLMSKKTSNFDKPQFISSKTTPRALGATRKPRDVFRCPPPNNPRPVLEIHLDINRTVALVRRG